MKNTLAVLFLLLTIPAARAGGFRLVPGAPLAGNATILEAHGRQGWLINQKLRFGDYHSTGIRRSAICQWSGGSGVPGEIWLSHMEGRQSIRFGLTDGTDTIRAEALSQVRSTDLIIGDNPSSLPNAVLDVLGSLTAAQENNFSAAFTTGDEGWELFLDNTASQLRRRQAAGFLRSKNHCYTIIPVWKVERKGKVSDMLFGSAGLEFQDENGRTRAAVSLIGNGAVYLANDAGAGEKLLFSAAAAALLLQDYID